MPLSQLNIGDIIMKYTKQNPPVQCIMTNSSCYKRTSKLKTIKGILWHSTGANNPNLKRYVQPLETDANYQDIINLIGKNTNKNDWNHIAVQAGVNAWIGKDAKGNVTTIQTLPWDYKPWGCGSGKKGSCNDGWIQFEICEYALTDSSYFTKVYKEACELTAYLCKLYNLNPKGTVTHNGVTVPVILCHKDSYDLGLGSGHADVLHWFKNFGKTMDDVRNDVVKLLEVQTIPPTEEVQEEMTQEKFNQMMNTWIEQQANKTTGASWSEAARTWAEKNGYIQGDAQGRTLYKKFLTREEFITVLYRILVEKLRLDS